MFKKGLQIFVLVVLAQSIHSQEKDKNFYITKGKGIEFHFFDDNYLLQVDFRGQFRASYPYDNFPVVSEDFNGILMEKF
jgi:hypothetical protein